MYVLALIAFLVTGTVASPPSYEAYRTQQECEALLPLKLKAAQDSMDENMGAGTSKIFGACIQAVPAGTKA